jgi:hypothetical protein
MPAAPTAPIAPPQGAPQGAPTEPQAAPAAPSGDMYAKGQPTGKPGTFFGENGQIVDARGNVVFDAAVRDSSGAVVDFKAMPPEYEPGVKPVDRTVGTVAQPFPVQPPVAPQGTPVAPQAGVTADQMNQPTSTGAGFKLSHPIRKAGEAAQRLPAEIADEQAGNLYRNSLIKNQNEQVKLRRDLEGVITTSDKLEKELTLAGIPVDNAGFLGAGARKLNALFGTEAGILLKKLNKELANVAIANTTALGGSMDTAAGQQLTKMAQGDETYPPVILKEIARRAMSDMTNLQMQANGAQEFFRKFGSANLNDFRQTWSKNADSRLFELLNIENSGMSDKQSAAAKAELFKDMNTKQILEFKEKLKNIQKLSTTGQL